MTSKSGDEYWFETSHGPRIFDDEEDILQSLNNIESQLTISENSNVFPLESIISQSGLKLILDDISSTFYNVIPPVDETIKKASNGEKYSLEIYKRFSEKIQLLDSALEISDGDIILKVILFLKSSLRTNIFFQQLSKRKSALKHYAYHLIVLNQFQELTDLYMATGNSHNLKHVFYLIGKDIRIKNVLYKKIKQFSVENLQTLSSHDDKLEIQDNLKFLEWQIENNQAADSVIEQLAILCRYEWEKNKNSNDRIMEFKKIFGIDEMAFEWTVMNVLVSMQFWPQLTAFFVKPNWFTKKNILKTALSQEIFVYGLSKHKPPVDILEQYLNCMTDSEKRIHLAQKLQCHKFVIQHYINQKDRLALIDYKTRVPPHQEEYFLIDNTLLSSDIKWKN